MSEEQPPKETKSEAQHRRWKKWYDSPKGIAYRQKLKEKKSLQPKY